MLIQRALRAYCRHSPLPYGKGRLSHWAYIHLPAPAPGWDRLSTGPAVYLDPGDWVQSQVWYLGLYEPDLALWWWRTVQAGMRVADVGAHIGQYTLLALQQGAEVDAFEPYRPNASRLMANVSANNGWARVWLCPNAVYDRVGMVAMRAPQAGNSGTGTVDGAGQIPVHSTTLDAYYAERPDPNLIKIDTEGAELRILHGAVGVLTRAHPWLVVECSDLLARHGDTIDELRAFLCGLDYALYQVRRGGGLVPLRGRPREGENIIAGPLGAEIGA